MYKGNIRTRANRENNYYVSSLESSKAEFRTFISNVRYALKLIGISYESLCRIIDAEGIHVNKDYPARVLRGKCHAPSLIYLNFFSKKLDIPLFKLLSPPLDFQDWFFSCFHTGNYTFPGPIVRFKGLKNNTLCINIKKGGLISTKGLQLDKNVIVKGGRIREVLNDGRVLNLGYNSNNAIKMETQKLFLKSQGLSNFKFNGEKKPLISVPKRIQFNSHL